MIDRPLALTARKNSAFAQFQNRAVLSQSQSLIPTTLFTPLFSATPPVESSFKLIDNDVYNLIRWMPKIDLHEHQSGSSDLALLKTALIQKGQQTNLGWEQIREEYRASFDADARRQAVTYRDSGDAPHPKPTHQRDLESYRRISDKINPLVKNAHSAYLAAHLFALEASSENVRYCEYRLNPEKHGISPEEVIRFVEAGFNDAIYRIERSRKKLDYGLIILFERHGNEEINPATGRKFKVDKAIELAQKTVELRQKGHNIVGVDLAGDELHCPVTEFKDAFDIIKAYNDTAPPEERIGITTHAGETANSGNLEGWQSVEQAIRIGWSPNTPMRLGHGIQVINSSDYLKEAFRAFLTDPHWQKKYPRQQILENAPLLKEIIDKNICLEMCPKSNVQTGAIAALEMLPPAKSKAEQVSWYKQHPALFLSRLGVPVTISSDNRTISNSDNTNDYVKLYKYGGALYEDRKRMVLNGLHSIFVFDPQKKQALLNDVMNTFYTLERDPAIAIARYKEKYNLKVIGPVTRLRLALRCEMHEISHMLQQFIFHVCEVTQETFKRTLQWLGFSPVSA